MTIKPGDQLWFVPGGAPTIETEPSWVTVDKVGRGYAYHNGGQKIDLKTMTGESGWFRRPHQYFSPIKRWRKVEAAQKASDSFKWNVERAQFHRGLSVTTIRVVAAELGIDLGEKTCR